MIDANSNARGKALETCLFRRRGNKSEYFLLLINTNYGYCPELNLWGAFDSGFVYECKFEFILDHVNEEIQTKLLFHLDLFI